MKENGQSESNLMHVTSDGCQVHFTKMTKSSLALMIYQLYHYENHIAIISRILEENHYI